MTDVNEVQLPGVGLRHDFVTRSGRAVGVVSHRSGRRDLVVYDPHDPDRAVASIELTEDEGHTLSELLGGSRIVEHLEELSHEVEGLSLEWLTLSAGSPLAAQTIADARIRSRTGASIVAIVRRDGEAVPAPGPDDQFLAGDTVIVVGTPEAVRALTQIVEASDSQG